MKNRSGSYKKVLISEGQLGLHREHIIRCLEDLKKTELSHFHFCTLYIILFLRLKHPKNWMQSKNISPASSEQYSPSETMILDFIPNSFELNSWEKNKLQNISFKNFFVQFNLKGIPLATNRTMINWNQGNWPIQCLHHIPSPRELLKMQAEGQRCITLIINPDEISKLVLELRDPLSFVIHDLDHADHFFKLEKSYQGQVTLFKLIESIYDKSEIKKSFKDNNQFKTDFHYVASDMNAYAIHMLKCFKSAFERYDLTLYHDVLKWWNLDPKLERAAQHLSTTLYCDTDEKNLVTFFEKNGSSEAYL